jgi:hypothetical protein
MKKHLQRLIVVSLFALSLGAAGTAFCEAAWAQGPPPLCSGSCNSESSCAGVCVCQWLGGSTFLCGDPD